MRQFNLDIIIRDRKFENTQRGRKPIDLVGKSFGRLIVVRFIGFVKKVRVWEVKCECGNINIINGYDLTRKNGRGVKSCGCIHSEIISKNETTHGMSKSQLWRIWHGIRTRCLNKNDKTYPRYGGHGVTVYSKWLGEHGFENFRDDMYESYLKHVKEFGEANTSLDRWPNNYGNYEPSNVRWATWQEQARNRHVSPATENYELHIKNLHNLRKLLCRAIGASYKTSPTMEKYLGCSLLELRKYLEFQFIDGMGWNNYGKGLGRWCMDHIIPCNRFDFTKEEDMFECFHYTNLRPRWWADNMADKFKIIKRENIQ
jgi:hypothetical protein